MTRNEFLELLPATQCAIWNGYARRIKERDGDLIFIYPNDNIEDNACSIDEMMHDYDFDGYDMYMLGVLNSNDPDNGKYLYLDVEDMHLFTADSFEECGINDDTLENFWEFIKNLGR